MVIISLVLLYIDERLGFRGWSITIGIPIVIMAANVTMLVLSIICYKKYVKYAPYTSPGERYIEIGTGKND